MGVEIGSRYIRIQVSKLKDFKQRVEVLTKRNGGTNIVDVIKRFNPVVRVFVKNVRFPPDLLLGNLGVCVSIYSLHKFYYHIRSSLHGFFKILDYNLFCSIFTQLDK